MNSQFGYQTGNSFLHRMDVRFKLGCLLLISTSSLNATAHELAMLSSVVLLTTVNLRLSLFSMLKEIRYALILFVLVILARSLSTPGKPVITWLSMTVTHEGMLDGLLVSWRLLLIIFLGICLIASTRTLEIKSALEWLFKPIPFIPGNRVATMIGLLIRFIPLILEQSKEIRDAQKARGIENRKNPIYRITLLIIPLMRKTFQRADELALAMEARCYSEDRSGRMLVSRGSDWVAITAIFLMCVFILI